MKSNTFRKMTALVLSVMLALSMCVTGISVSAAENTKAIYFAASSDWETANARFAVYAWADGVEGTFTSMTEVEDGIYTTEIADNNTSVIFVRMNPETTENNWDNKWNQTADLTVPTDKNCFAVNAGEWDGANGTWSVYEPVTTEPATEPETDPTEPVTTEPATVDTSAFTYSVLEDGTAEITGYTGDDSTIVIPSTIDGYKVTSIGTYAFSSNYDTNRTALVLPEGITSIGKGSFYNWYYLEKVQLPETLEVIGREAFSDCISLTTINFPERLESIGNSAFARCNSLKDVTINGGNLTLLDEFGFYTCDGLESVTINGNNATIDQYAFKNCGNLKSLSLNGIKIIGQDAFSGCYLEEVVLPDGLETIDYSAFALCSALKSVVIPKSVTFIQSGSFYGCDENLTIYGYAGSYAETYTNNGTIPFVALDTASIFGDIELDLTYTNGAFTATTALEAGTYSFKIDVNGIQYCAGYTLTNAVNSYIYSSDWKKATTLNATGGEYTFSFNPASETLTIAHKKTNANAVELTGDLTIELTQSADNADVFTTVADIEAGTYSFKLMVDGAVLGGNYTFTNGIYNALYNPSWKSSSTFTTDGGKYTISFNVKENTLSVISKKDVSTVTIVGGIELELTKSAQNADVFTATTDITAGTYLIKMSIDGTEYGCGCTFTDMFIAPYNSDWQSSTTFYATGGSYTFSYNTATNQLTVLPT